MPCTTVTNFCNEGKVMVLLSMVLAIKFCFVLDTHDTDAIAMNKRCKLNFRYFTMYLAISQQQGYHGFFEYGVYFFKTLYLFILNSIIR